MTLKLADLSTAALTQALTDTGAASLVWIWRFANGYQDSAASVRWNPVQGFTFGWNDYTLGGVSVLGATNAAGQSEKCVVYPGDQPLAGTVDPADRDDQARRPAELPARSSAARTRTAVRSSRPAAAGARFYDGTAFSFANNAGATQQSPVVPLHARQHAGDGLPAAVRLLAGAGLAPAPIVIPGRTAAG